MRKKLMVATAMLMAGSLFAAGCAQQGAAEGESSSTEVQYQNSIEEAEAYLDGVNERQDELNKEYAPEIRTLEAVSYTHLDVYKRQILLPCS